jgi:8-oxo-dGTP pyrophosphatase MutT (NUDIX family)
MFSHQGYLRHFIACNTCDLSHFVPFIIDGKIYGRIKEDAADFLLQETKSFTPHGKGISLSARITGFAPRSDALMHATAKLTKFYGKKLRNEMYPVVEKWGDEPLAQLDRVAVPWFGIRAWGVHVNGFVRRKDGLYLCIGQRAKNRLIEPGKLDNFIGGGLPIGLTLEQNLCKEAKEEAGLDAPMALKAKLIRQIDYLRELPDGSRNDTLFLYDLELPEDFIPKNTDGEVEIFHFFPLEKVAELICKTDSFKFNCSLVLTDFLMRHGFITPENAEFEPLKAWLQKPALN